MASCSSSSGETVNFQKEISDMIHGFGDNPNPEPGTVVLVECIVLQQLRSLLQQAYFISQKRGHNLITNYEIIFMMRKNLWKLKQLHDHQLSLDRIDKGLINAGMTEDLLHDQLTEATPKARPDTWSASRPKTKRNHIEIIEQLDEVNEVKDMKVNLLLSERKMRAVTLAERISLESYKNFHKARCSSFRTGSSNKYAKLEKWLNPDKELKITSLAMEVVGFIAYETVAELIDSVFKIREDANKKPGKSFSKLKGGLYCNPGATPNADYSSGIKDCPAITVAEIREAVRRYFMPGGGMNGLFSRNMSQDIPVRFIAF